MKCIFIVVLRRRPAWTDRILYKTIDSSNKRCELEVLSYNDINSIKLSDHRPVYGESSIQVIKYKNCTHLNFIYHFIMFSR